MNEQDVSPDDAEFGMSDHQSHNSLRAERDQLRVRLAEYEAMIRYYGADATSFPPGAGHLTKGGAHE